MFICLFVCLFLHVKVVAQNNFVVTIHNRGGSGVLGNIQVYYASDAGEHTAGEIYTTLETGNIVVGETRVLTLPSNNFQIAVGYILYALFYQSIKCTTFIPIAQESTITIGAGGEFFSKIYGNGVDVLSSSTEKSQTSCSFKKQNTSLIFP